MTYAPIDVDTPEPLRCPECGSRSVRALLWVALETKSIVEDGDDFDTDCFCSSCDASFRHSALFCV